LRKNQIDKTLLPAAGSIGKVDLRVKNLLAAKCRGVNAMPGFEMRRWILTGESFGQRSCLRRPVSDCSESKMLKDVADGWRIFDKAEDPHVINGEYYSLFQALSLIL
jgi:hypothetical protein